MTPKLLGGNLNPEVFCCHAATYVGEMQMCYLYLVFFSNNFETENSVDFVSTAFFSSWNKGLWKLSIRTPWKNLSK